MKYFQSIQQFADIENRELVRRNPDSVENICFNIAFGRARSLLVKNYSESETPQGQACLENFGIGYLRAIEICRAKPEIAACTSITLKKHPIAICFESAYQLVTANGCEFFESPEGQSLLVKYSTIAEENINTNLPTIGNSIPVAPSTSEQTGLPNGQRAE